MAPIDDPEGAELAERELRHAYRTVLQSPAGQAVVRDMLVYCGVVRSNLVQGDLGMDAVATAAEEGRRSYALRFLALSGGLDEIFEILTGERAPVVRTAERAIGDDDPVDDDLELTISD